MQKYEKLQKVGKIEPEKEKITIPPCGAAMCKCAIRPDGWVVPCEIVWNVKAGNLKEQEFIDIYENSEVMKEFRKTKYLDLKEMPECRNCEYQFVCFQGHRCYPFYYPKGIKDKKLYCYKQELQGVV